MAFGQVAFDRQLGHRPELTLNGGGAFGPLPRQKETDMSYCETYALTQSVIPATGTATIIEATEQYGIDTVTLYIKNTHASVAFDVATLQFKPHPTAAYVTVRAGATTAFTTTDNVIKYASVDFTTLAAAAEAIFVFQTNGVWAWKVIASGNAAASSSQVYGIGKGLAHREGLPATAT